MPISNAPDEVEKYLEWLDSHKNGKPNLINHTTKITRTKEEYKAAVEATTTDDYLMFAELHYALARITISLDVWVYGLYCAQQMAEIYLKAFIKLRGEVPKDTHSLQELLIQCRNADPKEPFINSQHIDVIVRMLDPFNEVGRYPAFRKGPQGGASLNKLQDVHALDYFVFKMRNIIPTSELHSSLFKGNHFWMHDLMQTDVYKYVTNGNINFQD